MRTAFLKLDGRFSFLLVMGFLINNCDRTKVA